MSSLPLGKKVSKSLAKFTKTLKKTPRHIADFLGLTLSPSHNKSSANPSYSHVASLYDCPCNYHLRQREEFERRLAKVGGEEKGDATTGIPESNGVVCRYDTEPESENGSVGDVEMPAVEQIMDDSGKERLSPYEVNERAERFIESFREDQKLQKQKYVHDY